MIILVYEPSFKRKLKKLTQKNSSLLNKIRQKLTLFVNDPYHPELQNHKLSGHLKILRAITIEYNMRIVFKMIENDQKALLVDIGTHDEVY